MTTLTGDMNSITTQVEELLGPDGNRLLAKAVVRELEDAGHLSYTGNSALTLNTAEPFWTKALNAAMARAVCTTRAMNAAMARAAAPTLRKPEVRAETEFMVMTAAAQMPATCRGMYKRVAVLEVLKGSAPKRIDARDRAVIRIVKTWERLDVGRTERCAFNKAVAAARALAAALNKGG
jgi:hypothetical protein